MARRKKDDTSADLFAAEQKAQEDAKDAERELESQFAELDARMASKKSATVSQDKSASVGTSSDTSLSSLIVETAPGPWQPVGWVQPMGELEPGEDAQLRGQLRTMDERRARQLQQICSRCEHGSPWRTEETHHDTGYVKCEYLPRFQYRAAHHTCYFWPARFELKTALVVAKKDT